MDASALAERLRLRPLSGGSVLACDRDLVRWFSEPQRRHSTSSSSPPNKSSNMLSLHRKWLSSVRSVSDGDACAEFFTDGDAGAAV